MAIRISQLNLVFISGIETSNLISNLRFRHLISNRSQSFVSNFLLEFNFKTSLSNSFQNFNSKFHFRVSVRIRKQNSFQTFNEVKIRNFISDFLLGFQFEVFRILILVRIQSFIPYFLRFR